MTSISKMVKKITTIFKEDAENLARETKFKQKESKLGPQEFVGSLLTGYLINPTASLEDICAILREKYNVEISKQGLGDRFNNQTVNFMSSLFNKALNTFAGKRLMTPEIFKNFTKVTLLDSSVISLPETLKDIFPGFGGNSSRAALRVQALFNWSSNEMTKIDITPATKNDLGYLGHLQSLTKGELLLQDLGYFKIANFKTIEEKGAYFISRYKNHTNLFDAKTLKEIDFITYLKNNEGKKLLAFNALLGNDELYPVRFVIRPVPTEVYEERLKKAIKASNRGKRSYELQEQTKYLYHWDIYITNIAKEDISDASIFAIYKLRWQVELLFKLFKGCVGIDKVAGRKTPRVICEIYIKLLLSLIVLYLTKADVLEEVPEISLIKAFNKLKTFGAGFINALRSKYSLKKLLNNLMNILKVTAVKEQKRRKKPTTLELLEALA